MKKRIPACLLAAVCGLLCVSLWTNYSYMTAKKQLKEEVLSRAYYALEGIFYNLGEVFSGIESEYDLNEEEKIVKSEVILAAR